MKNRLAARVIAGMIILGVVVATVSMPMVVKAEEITEEQTEAPQGENPQGEVPQNEGSEYEIPEEVSAPPEVPFVEMPQTVEVPQNELPKTVVEKVPEVKKSSRVYVDGIWISQTSLYLAKEGDTATISASVNPSNADNTYIHWCSSNSSVASVDNGYIRANGAGTCTITATTDEGNYRACCNVTVGTANTTSVASATVVSTPAAVDTTVNYTAVTGILNAKKNGTVTVNAASAKSFDMNVAAAMAARKDVKVACVFPFNGHMFKLTIPKGYNLAKTMNSAGYVEWLTLCQYNGIGGISVQMLS